MAELRQRTPLGMLHVHGWQRPTMEAALREGLELARAGRPVAGFARFAGQAVYLKGGPLRFSAGLRHGLAASLLRRRWPRVREYENLSWLIERHFQAALPLAAGVLLRRGLPCYQFLATARLDGARTLETFLAGAQTTERQAVLLELAREVARMHALRFVHHDLFPRNLLVLPAGLARRVVFLDAWAGGPAPQLRSSAYDLGCFFLEAGELLTIAEQAQLLTTYHAQRAAQERPVAGNWIAKCAAVRARLRRQLEREPERRRGQALPASTWPGPELSERLERRMGTPAG